MAPYTCDFSRAFSKLQVILPVILIGSKRLKVTVYLISVRFFFYTQVCQVGRRSNVGAFEKTDP